MIFLVEKYSSVTSDSTDKLLLSYFLGKSLEKRQWVDETSSLGVFIKAGAKATGVQTHPEYDYSQLGETWSDPRIFRIPNTGAGDTNILDDIYVAVMGGGFGTQFEGVGSNLTIINLENLLYYQIIKAYFLFI